MNEVGRLPAALLRIAARRWPDEFQDRIFEEWIAELAMMSRQSGRGGQAARFVSSLLLSALWRRGDDLPPPVHRVPVLTATLLLLSGVVLAFTPHLLVTVTLAGFWESILFADQLRWTLMVAVTVGLGVVLGHWLGSRFPAEPGERHGAATSAVLATACLAVAFLTRTVTGDFSPSAGLSGPGGVLLSAVVWAPAIGSVAVLAVRWWTGGHRWRAGLAAPVLAVGAAVLAMLAGALPMLIPALAYGGFRLASSFVALTEWNDVVPDDYPYAFYRAVDWLPFLFGAGAFVLVYGVRATRRKTRPVTIAAEETGSGGDATVPAGVTAAGAAALVCGVLSWAYASTLAPLMRAMNDTYDQQDGHWHISTSAFFGVQDLHWASILLAVLGLAVVTARHTRPGTATAVLTVLLLALDSFANRFPENLFAGPRVLLAGAAGAILVAWWVSGPEVGTSVVRLRRRLLVPAVLAAGAMPHLYWQLPEVAEHRYLPIGFFIPMVALPVLGAGLAAVCVAAIRPRPLTRPITLLLTALPVPAALYGFAVLDGSYQTITVGWRVLPLIPIALMALHLVVVLRTARRGTARAGGAAVVRAGRSVLLWVVLLLSPLTLSMLGILLMHPINVTLMAIADGGALFDDGTVFQPGIVTLLFLVGQWVAGDGRGAAPRDPARTLLGGTGREQVGPGVPDGGGGVGEHVPVAP